jgi:hypothetical protein
MQTIDSGFCRPSSGAGQAGAAQGFRGFHGSFADRADQSVRATVLADLGQSVGGHGGSVRGIQGVAAAVAKALSGQDVTGTDAADDVLKKIETSLHKAAQAMADRGVDGKTIDATIDRFRAQLAGALDGMVKGATGSSGTSGSSSTAGSSGASGSSGTTGSSGATSATGTTAPAANVTSVSKFVAREVRKERGAIDLVTAEGDRVSIRFRTKEVVTGSVTQATSSDGTTTTAAKSSVFSRGGMKIEVDGDLNEGELKAIGDLLGKVDDIATQFFSGDVQAAFSAAGSLGVDSDQIASYRLNLTYSRKVTAAYGAWGGSLPASTQPPATGDGTAPADSASGSGSAGSASGSTSGGSTSSASGTGATGSAASGSAASTAGSSSSAGSGTASTDGSSGASDSGASAGDSASAQGAASGATGSGSSATDPTAGDSNSGATDGTPATSTDTPPTNTPPASAQKTIIDFINDALSKLSSVNGAGRLSFSMHWKMSVLVTAIQTVQPAQPTTAADQAAANNTQLLGDSLQKIAAA